MNQVSKKDLLLIYKLKIRNTLEQLLVVYAGAMTVEQSDRLETVQKKCLKCIFGRRPKNVSYESFCKNLGIETLYERRTKVCLKFVKKSLKNQPDMFPRQNPSNYTRSKLLKVPAWRTRRYATSPRLFLADLYNKNM